MSEELAITLDVGEVFMDVIHEYPDLTVHLTLFLCCHPKVFTETGAQRHPLDYSG